MSDTYNCDVCGRLTNTAKDAGHHINQSGGFGCSKCGEWAKRQGLTCKTCGGNLLHGPYDNKCSCDPAPRITRSGRHFKEETAHA